MSTRPNGSRLSTVSSMERRPTAPACRARRAAAAGSRSPGRARCWRAPSVAIRPCGVRSRKPSRSRNGSYTSSMVSGSSASTAASAWTPTGSRLELLDDRRQQLAVGGVEAEVVDVEDRHRLDHGLLVDPPVAVDLGVVADPAEQPVDDPRRAPAALRDQPRGVRVDLDAEDARRPADDRGQLVLAVEVEPVGHAEAVPERAADPAGPGRRADHRERLEAQAQAPGARPLADHHVEREVLHRRVEDLLDRTVEAVDLVDEQDVALVEGGEDRGQVPGALDRRAARVADVHAQLAGDDRREGRLAEAGRAVQQDVVGRLSPALRRLEQDVEARLDLALADVLVERPRAQRPFHGELAEIGGAGREEAQGRRRSSPRV